MTTGLRAQASPVYHVRADAPPFLLLNAQEDEKLEEEADELSSLLRSQGVSAETSIISGTNHFTILSLVGNGDDRLIDRMVEFAKWEPSNCSGVPPWAPHRHWSRRLPTQCEYLGGTPLQLSRA